MADVSGNAGSVGDIIEGERGDERVKLHEERKGLPNPTGGAEDDDFAIGNRFRGESSAEKTLLQWGSRSNKHRSEHFWLKNLWILESNRNERRRKDQRRLRKRKRSSFINSDGLHFKKFRFLLLFKLLIN